MTSEDNNFDRKRRSASPTTEGGAGKEDGKKRKGFSSSEGHTVSGKQLFVSNVPFDLSWQDLKDAFKEQVGETPYIKLYNNEQGKPRGCGTVEFKTKESAKIALEKMNGYELKGRKIKVNEAFDEPRDEFGYLLKGAKGQRRADMDRKDMRRSDYRDMRNDGARMLPQRDSFSSGGDNTYGLKPQFLAGLGISGAITNRLWVSNFGDERVDEKKLMEIFRLAGKVVMIQLSRDREGKSKGHAIVEYDHPVEAVQAISMLNNQSVYGKKMYVRLDRVGAPRTNQFPNRIPDGLSGLGMGLGTNGTPLLNVSENFSPKSEDSMEGTLMRRRLEEEQDRVLELKKDLRAKDNELSTLSAQVKSLGGIERLLKLSEMSKLGINGGLGEVRDSNNAMMSKETSKSKTAPLTTQEMFDMFTSASRRSQYEPSTTAASSSASIDYDHRSVLDPIIPKGPITDQFTSYGSRWL